MGDEERTDEFEKQLKAAMARGEAPAWFEARVMNAVNQSGALKSRQGMALPHRGWRWVTAGAAAVVMITAWNEWAHHIALEHIKQAHMDAEEREAGEAAKAKLLLAMKITSAKLAEIQAKVDEAQRND